MKKLFIFVLLSFIGGGLFAQSGACPVDISAIVVTVPTCGASNGAFDIETGFRGSDSAQVSLDGFSTWQDDAATPGIVHFTNKPAGTYTISVRSSGNTGSICQTFTFTFIASQYDTTATLTATPASGCFNGDGSIALSGLVSNATDSVSWLSNLTPTFVAANTLAPLNTINGLIPGNYYVILKAAGSNFCYSTHKVNVGNTGVACAAPTFCGNAADPNNMFPNGTFGNGGNPDSTNAAINGPPLAAGITQYPYQPLGYRGPEDGFYSIANNTYLGSDFLGHDPTGPNVSNTPFNGQWFQGYDHDHSATPHDGENGYMLIVNASYAPNIVIQQTIPNMCTEKKYQFSAWIRDLDQNVGQIPAKVEFIVNGVGLYTTPVLPTGVSGWQQVGFTFQTNTPTAVISIRNDTTGGLGNDWAMDDIYVGDCQPSIALTPLAISCGSTGDSVIGTVNDASDIYDTYQWQVNKNDGFGYLAAGPITTVAGFNTSVTHTYTATAALPTPIVLADSGWTYKLILGTTAADISSPTCYFTDTSVLQITNTCAIILPIKLVSINALQLNQNSGEVNWVVADQIDVNHYVLEKSTNGIDFTDITSVTASSATSYVADDNDLYTGGTNYYRVEEVDDDGTVHYSKIVTITPAPNTTNNIEIYPNPVVNELYISKPQNTVIKSAFVIDAIGQTLVQVNTFNNITNSIELSTLPTGFYELKVIDSQNQVTNLKFIKK
jgi:Secretion system C-terminal sorting domain